MTDKKVIEIELSEKSINELLDLQEELKLEKIETRKKRYEELKKWRGKCLFG